MPSYVTALDVRVHASTTGSLHSRLVYYHASADSSAVGKSMNGEKSPENKMIHATEASQTTTSESSSSSPQRPPSHAYDVLISKNPPELRDTSSRL
jgi:hypothetical protein